MENKQLAQHANNIRKNIIKMVHSAGSGHIGGSLSAADILSVLYFEEMNISEKNLDSTDRDRFVASKGHSSPLVYGTLMERGFLDVDLIDTFRQVDSDLQGHPNMNMVKGVDMSTGSLGQGISAAVGMALANKLDNNDNRVFALLGDGESQEGQVWEAAMAAGHYKLDNLIAFLDFNHLQIDGAIEDVMNPNPLDEKFKAFNWHVIEIDGHNIDEIKNALKEANEVEGKPVLIYAHTVKGKGVSFMENEAGWHGVAPSDEEFAQAMKELEALDNE